MGILYGLVSYFEEVCNAVCEYWYSTIGCTCTELISSNFLELQMFAKAWSLTNAEFI